MQGFKIGDKVDMQENQLTMSQLVAQNLTRLSKDKTFEICTTTNLYPIAKGTVFIGEGNSIWILDNKGNKVTELEMHAFKCYH